MTILKVSATSRTARVELGVGTVTMRRVSDQKRGQEPIVQSTRRAIWLLVPDPFSEA